jgi:GDP-L-fucose synthase
VADRHTGEPHQISRSDVHRLSWICSELDLLDRVAVTAFYQKTSPDVVMVAAGEVGGSQANNTHRADFIFENLQIQNNLIWGAHEAGVRRLIFLGSSCIYPRLAPQPMPESCLLTGALEDTNRPYALAKIAGLELVNALRVQYRHDYFSVMPTNLYGPGDNFDADSSHVLPALVRRFVEAVDAGLSEVVIWGSGAPRREFLGADDCAAGIVFLAEHLTAEALAATPQGQLGFFHVNVGQGSDVSISELATMVAKAAGFAGQVVYDASKPDGTPRKLLDVSMLQSLGWRPRQSLQDGIATTVAWYRAHRLKMRGSPQL